MIVGLTEPRPRIILEDGGGNVFDLEVSQDHALLMPPLNKYLIPLSSNVPRFGDCVHDGLRLLRGLQVQMEDFIINDFHLWLNPSVSQYSWSCITAVPSSIA
ncbi:hypothetical protein D3C86_1896560 [compost metagenome]